MQPQPRKNSEGFTIIEVLTSIFILGVALAAINTILNVNFQSAAAAKNNYIANLLAQEGMEVVRNIRDTDWLDGSGWGVSIPDGTYSVEWNSTSLGGSYGDHLKISNAGIYSYSTGTDTIFTRRIDISSPPVGPFAYEKKIVITMNWTERGNAKSLIVEDHLFDWGE